MLNRNRIQMGFVRQLFGKSLATASPPEPTSESTPGSTPRPTSAPEPSEAPVYVVHDPGGTGIVVDLSLQSVGTLPEHPALHAAELLDRLMHDAAFAGKWDLGEGP